MAWRGSSGGDEEAEASIRRGIRGKNKRIAKPWIHKKEAGQGHIKNRAFEVEDANRGAIGKTEACRLLQGVVFTSRSDEDKACN